MFHETREYFMNYFGGLNNEFVNRIILSMEYHLITKDSRNNISCYPILNAGKIPKWIYFLISGILFINSVNGVTFYAQLFPKSIFGEAYIIYGIPSTYSLMYNADPRINNKKTNDNTVETYRVSASAYLEIIKNYRGVYQILKKEALKKRRI